MFDTTQGLLTLDGHGIEDGGRPVTLGRVLVNALLSDADKPRGEDKLRRYELATRIHAGPCDLSGSELAECKKLVVECYSTLIVGQVLPMLEVKK